MPTVAVLAHRGSPDPANGVGENTIEAFARARRLGADGVELDARLAADGAVVVCHDPVLGGIGPVGETLSADLPDEVPLLSAALTACRGMTVNIEIKNLPGEPSFDPGERLADQVAELAGGLAGGRPLLSSRPSGRGPLKRSATGTPRWRPGSSSPPGPIRPPAWPPPPASGAAPSIPTLPC